MLFGSFKARLLLSLPVLAALGAGAYWSLRLAHADLLFRGGSPAELRRASSLVPSDARYRAAVGDLRKAVSLNPSYSSAWVELGLEAEINQDYEEAERCLLQAARADRTFLPAWTLTNYYFRRNQPEKFWTWSARAADMAYQDPTPLFRLCWRMTQDPRMVLERAIPDRPRVLRWYLGFLMREGHGEAGEPVAQRLVEWNDRDGLPLLLTFFDRQMERGHHAAALKLWNSLARTAMIPHGPLDPGRGISLTNGDFSTPLLARGFDWRGPAAGGVAVRRRPSFPALDIVFSGRQPEACDVLYQLVPLAPAREYLFRYEVLTSGIRFEPGLTWRITEAATGRALAASRLPLAEESSVESLPFFVPADVSLARLALVYRRVPGTTRIEGTLRLRNLALGFRQ